jgi:hypothetical protein
MARICLLAGGNKFWSLFELRGRVKDFVDSLVLQASYLLEKWRPVR